MDQWSLEDNTTGGKGYCRILLDGMDVGVDVFPFRKGGDPAAIKRKAAAIVEVLNSARAWCDSEEGGNDARLIDAVNALDALNEPIPAPNG